MTNIEKLKEAEKLVTEVFMDSHEDYAGALNCSISDISIVRIKMEVEQEEVLNSMRMKKGA